MAPRNNPFFFAVITGECWVCRGSSAHTDLPFPDIAPGSPILAKPWPFPKEKEFLPHQERAPVLDVWKYASRAIINGERAQDSAQLHLKIPASGEGVAMGPGATPLQGSSDGGVLLRVPTNLLAHTSPT